MPKTNNEILILSAANFELPTGAEFHIESVDEPNAEIEVGIDIESGEVVPWRFGALEGQLITIAGVTGNKTITYIDKVDGTIEIDAASDATVSDGAVAYVTPTFAALPF